ncbi:MAG: hypothetical protein QOC80_1028 [Frankiaceae bacterium]|nr:hypothetical protein [Frankiaceae bacterium]
MQIALRPVAIRALLLVAGVVLGLVAFLTVFAAATSSSADHGLGGALGDGGHTVTARGVTWN